MCLDWFAKLRFSDINWVESYFIPWLHILDSLSQRTLNAEYLQAKMHMNQNSKIAIWPNRTMVWLLVEIKLLDLILVCIFITQFYRFSLTAGTTGSVFPIENLSNYVSDRVNQISVFSYDWHCTSLVFGIECSSYWSVLCIASKKIKTVISCDYYSLQTYAELLVIHGAERK